MPVVTLSTDIGLHDFVTGAVKGQFLSAHSSINLVDITHTLSPFDYPQTAYVCYNAYRYFPAGTIHVLLINLFEVSPTHFLIARCGEQYIICPDNGIITMMTGCATADIRAVPLYFEGGTRGTLDYTRAIAATLKEISEGKPVDQIGETVTTVVEKYPLRSTVGVNWLEGQIIFIDNFENVIVNITKEEFEEHRNGRNFHISFMRNEVISNISENYSSVNPGEKMAWFNTAGYLELSVNKGNMAGLFGLRRFSSDSVPMQSKWFYQTVRIYFE